MKKAIIEFGEKVIIMRLYEHQKEVLNKTKDFKNVAYYLD